MWVLWALAGWVVDWLRGAWRRETPYEAQIRRSYEARLEDHDE